MSKKSLVFHLIAHNGYFRHLEGSETQKNNILFYSISQVYLPLLNMFANLEADGIPFKIGMTITPSLCSQLSDPILQQSYIEWLDKLILLGEAEVTRNKDNEQLENLSKTYLKHLKRDKRDFIETFNQDIISKFAYYAKRGNIELFATAATHAFLPHYIDIPEAINAQIETGLQSHKNYFDILPEGFYLPRMGYTTNIEKALRAYGLSYTILDSHGLLFATPTPEKGIFSPVRCENSLAIFGRDPTTPQDIISSTGYMYNPIYRDSSKDIGFDESIESLRCFLGDDKHRVATGFNYYSQTFSDSENHENIYDLEKAKTQAGLDAQDFLNKKAEKLTQAQKLTNNEDVSLVCTFDSLIFGQKWYEGIEWLSQVFRQAAQRDDISMEHCSELAKNQFSLQKVKPFMSAASGTGYGEDLLDSSNDWMIRYVRKATERMIDLSDRFTDDSGLKARALNLAAKEVLLAQSSDWQVMIHDRIYPEYAANRFTESVNAFSIVFDSLGSNSISTEWLTKLEREHTIFPWINYRIFSQKK